ncbi:leukocyte surface antigen CD53-like isoform X1 [Anguilla rostrata]|uniref:leukocyte surface antigen CD53-like isoform X1 n=1 Tax=Anguilla rostrata TaxID=7938 RepID=UPI0030D373D8
MVQQSCVRCLKNTMCFLNFLCWLCGAFVVAFGIFMMMNSRFSSLITSFWPIYPANTLVVTGTIVTCVSYLGFLGALRENRCMLISFFILLFILMLVELAMACIMLVYNREIDTFFEKDLLHSLESYKQSSEMGNETLREDFDAVQSIFRCCGVHGVSDWEGHIPISCCTTDPCLSHPQKSWQEGCHMKLRNWFARNFLSTGAGVVTMFIIQSVWARIQVNTTHTVCFPAVCGQSQKCIHLPITEENLDKRFGIDGKPKWFEKKLMKCPDC